MSLTLSTAFLALAASEFEPLVAFYGQLFGRTPTTLLPDRYAEFRLPNLRLGIFAPKAAVPPASPINPQGLALCLEVRDLEAAIAHLQNIGCPPPGEVITASHGREIYAFDPEGNWLILHEQA